MTDVMDIVFSTEGLYSTEAKMMTAQRKKLPDSSFGLPVDRKYPLYDAKGKPDSAHIKSAMAYFKKCPEEKRKPLAKAILKAINIYNKDATNTKKIDFKKDDLWYTYAR